MGLVPHRVTALARFAIPTLTRVNNPVNRAACYNPHMNEDLDEKRYESRIRDKRLWEAIGKRLRRARGKMGLSVEDLAPMVDLAPQTIYRLEIGLTGTTISRLLEFCKVLGLDIAELLGVAEDDTTRLRLAFRGRHLTEEQLRQIVAYADDLTRQGPTTTTE